MVLQTSLTEHCTAVVWRTSEVETLKRVGFVMGEEP